jgi:hypothetical protein
MLRFFPLPRIFSSLFGVSALEHLLVGVRLLKKLCHRQPMGHRPSPSVMVQMNTLTRFTGDRAARRGASIFDFNLVTSSAKFSRLQSG